MKGKLTLMACLLGLVIFCADFINTFAQKLSAKPVSSAILIESTKLKNRVVAFLQWYKINLHKANRFPLLVKDSIRYYSINKQAAHDYLNLYLGHTNIY